MAPMNLDSILQDFDDIIIARGQAYFENGLVTSLEEKRPAPLQQLLRARRITKSRLCCKMTNAQTCPAIARIRAIPIASMS